MAKYEVSLSLDQDVLAVADADAKAAGLNRSELVEQALRHEHLRITLKSYTTTTSPALNIDDYAQKIYRANRASGL
ncbi:ribbon-helix-helix protein, CopG family [Mycolicibacterium iranicum]|uniref:Antitoxin n=1 Tax=Mycolicibacterium iranicum TaxID=912594 RepID=A0A178LLN8_MYCIR|nr:ribbon-helix-helix protein, CopG family [Mycolicibacterium iranicum]OAN32065.1 antitoxin [Mycolicibacterium iranicum]